jgi:hypothetical protein
VELAEEAAGAETTGVSVGFVSADGDLDVA